MRVFKSANEATGERYFQVRSQTSKYICQQNAFRLAS